MTKFKLEIPRAAALVVPFDFTWSDTHAARNVSAYTADLVVHASGGDATLVLAQDGGITSRKNLTTTEATFPTAEANPAEVVLKQSGTVVDRLFGTVSVLGP